jgi:FhaA, N-terminal domain/FHA domain
MAILRSIEYKIEALLEGMFGRAFRTHVQPVELARKLAKEMDDGRTISVSRVYVPNEYTVYLSPDDRSQFETYEASLVDELQEHLADHARRERYALLTPPRVLMETDEDLAVGEFGIATRMVQPERGRPRERAAGGAAKAGETMVYKQTPVPTEAVSADELGMEPEPAALEVDGERHAIDKHRVVIGRSRDCDIQIADPNVSRRHAEVRREGSAFWLVDLGSTNGIDVNGRRQARAKLTDGDRLTLGTTEAIFRTQPG